MFFSSFNLPNDLIKKLAHLGYHQMTPVQEQSLPFALQNKDLIVQSCTGSGKTVAFSLTILNKIQIQLSKIQAVIICPTHELSDQVTREIRRIGEFLPNLKIMTLCGGEISIQEQSKLLQYPPHILIGTTGRILKHLQRQNLSFENVHTLVLDEADRLLEMGFYDEIIEIVKKIPQSRQTLLFSATFPQQILSVSQKIQKMPDQIIVDSQKPVKSTKQYFYQTTLETRKTDLLKLLLQYQPETTVIFCNTKQECKKISQFLRQNKIITGELHGDLEQSERTKMLTFFANRSLSVLVATDLAARGLNIEELTLVINFELASDPETHLHRMGRTGRAGQDGIVLNLVFEGQLPRIKKMANDLHFTIEWGKWINTTQNSLSLPQMVTFIMNGGKKNKLRPGDILGALTKEANLPSHMVGKISILENVSYVAIHKKALPLFNKWIVHGKIKGRSFKSIDF